MHRRLSRTLVLAIVATGVISACRAQPSPQAKAIAEFAANPPVIPGPVRLTKVTPDRLALSGDRIAPQTLEAAYAIDDPQTVTEATLELYHPDLFSLAKMTLELPIQATGVVSFRLEPEDHAIGPQVRFRVSCPERATEWYVMGQIPTSFDAKRAATFGIHSVKPESVPARLIPSPRPDAAIRAHASNAEVVHVLAGELTPACRLDAQVNGADVVLGNLNLIDQNRTFQGLLYLRDLDFMPVARRYAELKLGIKRGGGGGYAAISRLAFDEQ